MTPSVRKSRCFSLVKKKTHFFWKRCWFSFTTGRKKRVFGKRPTNLWVLDAQTNLNSTDQKNPSAGVKSRQRFQEGRLPFFSDPQCYFLCKNQQTQPRKILRICGYNHICTWLASLAQYVVQKVSWCKNGFWKVPKRSMMVYDMGFTILWHMMISAPRRVLSQWKSQASSIWSWW